jgi:hypothetical protein
MPHKSFDRWANGEDIPCRWPTLEVNDPLTHTPRPTPNDPPYQIGKELEVREKSWESDEWERREGTPMGEREKSREKNWEWGERKME